MSQQVIGWDFLRKHMVSLVWTEFGDLQLWDRRANVRADLVMKANVTGKWPNLAGYEVVKTNAKGEVEVAGTAKCYTLPAKFTQTHTQPKIKSFQDWSQIHKEEANKNEKAVPIPKQYQGININ